MVIACLGWGSLIWKPGTLPLASEWFSDGPLLPIEFARVSDGGELATVVCVNAPPTKVLWAVLAVQTLEEACAALREREQIPDERQDGVGTCVVEASSLGVIAEWANARQIDAVIWTALPPRIDNVEGRVPSIKAALAYLDGLSGGKLEHARSYIEQVPAQIDTAYRREIAKTLEWR
jgi:hypothetical protein